MSTNYSELTFNSSDDLAKLQQRVVELENKNAEYERAEQLLRALVEGTAAATNADFLKLLVCKLAVALNVRYTFITECTDPKPRTQATRLRTLAFWMGQFKSHISAFRVLHRKENWYSTVMSAFPHTRRSGTA